LLPLEPEEERAKQATVQYLFEPDPAEVMNQIVPRFIEVAVYQAILESKASQFSAQMVAMRNATDAAGDLIGDLTLAANKARQARITKEMLEIASGAEAMKGQMRWRQRRSSSRDEGEEHRRSDHGTGGEGDPGPRLQRRRGADRREGRGERRAARSDPPPAAVLRRPGDDRRDLRDRDEGHRPHLPVLQ